MKKSLLATLLLSFISSFIFSQNLAKQWDNSFGGIDVESLTSLLQASDGGYVLSGYTRSGLSGDITEPTRGGNDFWIIKTDSLGQKVWDKRFGGLLEDRIFSADKTTDGGFIFGGFTASDSGGDISQASRGSLDFWIVKTDSLGNKLWDKRYGGDQYEQISCLNQTLDGGYILGGVTFSDSSFDVSQPTRGAEDFWIVKTDANGIKLWDKRYGGDGNDFLLYLQQTSDGGYILGGKTVSDSSGDVTQNSRGDIDYWVVRTDGSGNKLWDKRFGGDDKDFFRSLEQTVDGGFILGGYIYSDISGDVSQPTRDTSFAVNRRGDFWIVKLDTSGNKSWDKRFGGFWVENGFGYISQTQDKGYLFGGNSYSGISGDKTENNFGYEQSWLVKTDSTGIKEWDKTIFTNGEDEESFTIQTTDGCILVGNSSYADSAGDKTQMSKGNYDYWFIKFCPSAQPQLPVAAFTVSNPNICAGGCFSFSNFSSNAGSFQWYFPGAVPASSTMAFPTGICYSDSGHYDVTLIAINGSGSDTLTMPGIIVIHPLPAVTITQIGDTLFAPQGFASYIWSVNNVPDPNDSIYYYVVVQNGDYAIYVTDTNGCPNSDTLYSVIAGLKEFTVNGFSISLFPNPVKTDLHVEGLENVIGGDIHLFDVTGRLIIESKIYSDKPKISVGHLRPGIYFLEASKGEIKFFARFVKE